jgi:hypothetical protein
VFFFFFPSFFFLGFPGKRWVPGSLGLLESDQRRRPDSQVLSFSFEITEYYKHSNRLWFKIHHDPAFFFYLFFSLARRQVAHVFFFFQFSTGWQAAGFFFRLNSTPLLYLFLITCVHRRRASPFPR